MNIAVCDSHKCENMLKLKPLNEEQALSVAAGGVPPDWVRDRLFAADWEVDGIQTFCPRHRTDEEIIDADDEVILDDPEDQITDFFEELIVPSKKDSLPFPLLYELLTEDETKGMSKKEFGKSVRALGYEMKRKSHREKGRVKTTWHILGITWKSSDPTARKTRAELLIDVARLEVANLELTEALAHFQGLAHATHANPTTPTTPTTQENS